MTAPFVEELSPPPEVGEALRAFADQPGVVMLDSALVREPVGRYSFLTADPFTSVIVQKTSFGTNPFERLRSELREFASEPLAGLPPFQGARRGCSPTSWAELLREFAELPSTSLNSLTWPSAFTTGLSRGTTENAGLGSFPRDGRPRLQTNALAAQRIVCVSFRRDSIRVQNQRHRP